jgi:hypothetical protein
MRENLEIPPWQCPSIPTAILLPHTYSTILITARQFGFNKLLLPHTQSVVFIIAREFRNPFPRIIGSILPPGICYLSISLPGSFPSFGDFHNSLNP